MKRDALIYIFAYKMKIPRVFDFTEVDGHYHVRYEEPMFSGKYHIKEVKKCKEIDDLMKPLMADLEFRAGGLEFPTTEEEKQKLDKLRQHTN